MSISQEIINNLGSFASIISIPITIIIFLIENNRRIRRATEKCAEELCKEVIQYEELDMFKVEKIISSILKRGFLLGKKSVTPNDVLSESLLLIRETPFLSKDQKQEYERRLMLYWSKNAIWLKSSRSNLRRILVLVLSVFLVFIVVDYFSGGMVLGIVKLISFSIVLKALAGIILTLIGLVITIFFYELFTRDQNHGQKKLEETSISIFDNINTIQSFYDYEVQEGFSFTVGEKRQSFKKKVVDTGPQVISRRGYRVIYELEYIELVLLSLVSNFKVVYRVEKTSMVNRGLLFDVLYIELFQNEEKLSQISKLIKINPDNPYKGSEYSEIQFIHEHFNRFEIVNDIVTRNHRIEKAMVSVVNYNEAVKLYVDGDTLLPIRILAKNRIWELMK